MIDGLSDASEELPEMEIYTQPVVTEQIGSNGPRCQPEPAVGVPLSELDEGYAM